MGTNIFQRFFAAKAVLLLPVALLPLQLHSATTDYISNPSFSNVDEFGMAIDWKYPEINKKSYDFEHPDSNIFKITTDSTTFHTAAPSLCITVQKDTAVDGHVSQSIKSLSEVTGRTLRIKAWIKSEKTSDSTAGQVVLHSGALVGPPNWWAHIDWAIIGTASGTIEWTLVEKDVVVPDTAGTLDFRLYMPKSVKVGSKVWFDDIEIEDITGQNNAVISKVNRSSLSLTAQRGVMRAIDIQGRIIPLNTRQHGTIFLLQGSGIVSQSQKQFH